MGPAVCEGHLWAWLRPDEKDGLGLPAWLLLCLCQVQAVGWGLAGGWYGIQHVRPGLLCLGVWREMHNLMVPCFPGNANCTATHHT